MVARHFLLLETQLLILRNLTTVHENAKLVAKEVDTPETEKRRRRSNTDDSEPKRQCTLPDVLTRNSILAQKMRNLLSEYIIEDMQPLSTVESPGYRKLISNICSTQISDRKSFTLHLDKAYGLMLIKIKQILEKN